MVCRGLPNHKMGGWKYGDLFKSDVSQVFSVFRVIRPSSSEALDPHSAGLSRNAHQQLEKNMMGVYIAAIGDNSWMK